VRIHNSLVAWMFQVLEAHELPVFAMFDVGKETSTGLTKGAPCRTVINLLSHQPGWGDQSKADRLPRRSRPAFWLLC